MSDNAKDEGYNRILIGSEDSWVHESAESFDQHMVEAMQLTLAKLPPRVTALCQYDGRLFSREQQDRISSVHQLSLADGRLYRNYWVVSTKSWDVPAPPEKVNAARAPEEQAQNQR